MFDNMKTLTTKTRDIIYITYTYAHKISMRQTWFSLSISLEKQFKNQDNTETIILKETIKRIFKSCPGKNATAI